jgi:hypothetical protein
VVAGLGILLQSKGKEEVSIWLSQDKDNNHLVGSRFSYSNSEPAVSQGRGNAFLTFRARKTCCFASVLFLAVSGPYE